MSTPAEAAEDIRYRFAPLERRGVLLGLGAAPLATLVGGIVVALAALQFLPGAAGVGAAVIVVPSAVLAACWPLAGRPPVEWAPTVVAWLLRRGDRPVLDTEPTAGAALRAGGPAVGERGVDRARRRPTSTSPFGLRLVAAPAVPGEGAIGVVEDRVARSWAAVIPVRGPALALLGPEDQARHLAAWGSLLAGAARGRSGIRRLQWVEQCGPADPGHLRAAASDASGPPDACRSYQQFVATESHGLVDHRCHLVVAVRGGRRMGPRAAATDQAELLRRELRLLRAHLRSGDIGADAALDPAGLAALLRAACDPTMPPLDACAVGAGLAGAWPSAVEERWGAVRVDGSWQATYWVAEWPRLAVGPDVLTPLLIGGGPRTVALTMAPVPAAQAIRQVQSARTAAIADDALRARAGFLATAQREREVDGVRRRESELADGHADYRYSGYVTVAASSLEQLDAACAETEHAARQSQLVLRRLYGRQAEARSWTLPVARGIS